MKVIDRLKRILLRQLWDNRTCPYCQKSFIPSDPLRKETLNLMNELFTEDEAIKAEAKLGEITERMNFVKSG